MSVTDDIPLVDEREQTLLRIADLRPFRPCFAALAVCRLNRQHLPVERVSKLNKATGSKEYAGDIEGSSATEWLMAYHPDKSAVFVGLERIKGTIGGRHGSLVLQHVDTFTDGAAKATLTVVSGRRTPGRDR